METTSQFQFTGDIQVQTINRQSGIFIGERNHAVGWSSHGKENSVVGEVSGKSNILFNNIFILNDPDYIDTPIDDRDVNLLIEEQGGEEHTSSLTLDCLNVNSLINNSSVFLGESHLNGMDANQKANYAQGNLYGNENKLLYNIHTTNDQDVLDGIIDDRDIKITKIEGKND